MMLPFSISRFGSESAIAPGVSTKLRLSSYESVPGAVGAISALPTHVECAPCRQERLYIPHDSCTRMVVHNHGAMFDMLARIHKVDAKHVEIALIAAKS